MSWKQKRSCSSKYREAPKHLFFPMKSLDHFLQVSARSVSFELPDTAKKKVEVLKNYLTSQLTMKECSELVLSMGPWIQLTSSTRLFNEQWIQMVPLSRVASTLDDLLDSFDSSARLCFQSPWTYLPMPDPIMSPDPCFVSLGVLVGSLCRIHLLNKVFARRFKNLCKASARRVPRHQ